MTTLRKAAQQALEALLEYCVAVGLERGTICRVSDVCIVEMERFAALVAAAEREECAKLCDAYTTQDNLESCNDRTVIRHETAECLAIAIRSRT